MAVESSVPRSWAAPTAESMCAAISSIDANTLTDAKSNPQHKEQKSHPAWVVPYLFFALANAAGPKTAIANLAQDMYGADAQLYMNVAEGIQSGLQMFGAPLLGALSDRYGRKPFMLLSSIVHAMPPLTLWAMGPWPESDGAHFGVYLIMYSLSGCLSGMSIATTLAQAHIADVCDDGDLGAAMGLYLGPMLGLCALVAPLAFSALEGIGGMQLVVRGGVVLALSVPFFAMLLPARRAHVEEPQPRLRCMDFNPFRYFRSLSVTQGMSEAEVCSTHYLRKLCFMILFMYTAKSGLLNGYTQHALQAYDFSTQQATLLLTTYGTTAGATQMMIPLFAKCVSKPTMAAVGCALGFLSAALASVPMFPGFVLYFAEAVLACSYIAYTMSVSLATESVKNVGAGEVVGVMNMAQSLASGLGPVVCAISMSAFTAKGYPEGAFICLGFLMLVGFFLCLTLRRRNTQQMRGPEQLL